ncbi:MAG: hypothetical protein ACYDDC_08770, partial [Thermoplasmataceae archaeon]
MNGKKSTVEGIFGYLFLMLTALTTVSLAFFIYQSSVGKSATHLLLLQQNLPFAIKYDNLSIIAIFSTLLIILLSSFLFVYRRNGISTSESKGFRLSAIIFMIQYLVFSITSYIEPYSPNLLNSFTNFDFAIYYSIWSLFLLVLSIVPVFLTLIIVNIVLYRKKGTQIFSRFTNTKHGFLIALPVSIFSDILWSGNITTGLQYFILFYSVAVLVFESGFIIGIFASITPLASNVTAYSFSGLFTIPFLILIFVIVLA